MNEEVTLVSGSWSEFSRSNTPHRWNLFGTREESRGPNLIADRLGVWTFVAASFSNILDLPLLSCYALRLSLSEGYPKIYRCTYSMSPFRLNFKRHAIGSVAPILLTRLIKYRKLKTEIKGKYRENTCEWNN